ncbi:F-box/kelch-repeat protein SKIP6-like isoform X2 [Capsicum annuum]|uniref:F-box/kelch-repeat protein SKIP6-like isoform X2 n=1 Tax=Capsicum annuum TaxID=4072 RepID=UPI001FB0EBA8|nr:F-box/kelch-repeat protein SKIP6-like isoform X2 [Capsicum annuum]XP_047269966.1 F-box/kelch-repeat protein SKIP6-like isoform X2 [Capsicum annuum]
MADVAPQSQLIPNLPDDIALQCLARIPRSHHPTLYLVSKSWRSTLTSPALYNTRSLLRTTENFLYLKLRINSTFHWFNCWEMGPRMRIGREFAAAGVVNGKIYVMGGCVVDNWARSMNWAEVFDPVTGLWTALPSPIEVRDKWMHASAVVGGRVYAMADRGGVVYDVEGCQWRSVSKRLDLGWRGRAAVVGGVLYCYDYLGKIRGYDVKEDVWKELRGVDKGLPKFLCGATMVNFDDRLCVVWEGKGSGKEVDIMCAEIQVWRDEDGGLSGNILWSDMILVVPNGASIVQCLAVDL